MQSNRVDDAVHDLWRTLESRSVQAKVPTNAQVRVGSSPPTRSREDLLHVEIGKASDIAQPGGFRRDFVGGAGLKEFPAMNLSDLHKHQETLIAPSPMVKRRTTLERRTVPERPDWSQKQLWLFRFIMCVTIVNFSNQTVMTSFLPVVLYNHRGFSLGEIGLLSAIFPFASLVFTNAAVRRAGATRNTILLHSLSLFIMAFFTLGFGLANMLPVDISSLGFFFARFGQGSASALYFAVTIAIVTRTFPDDIPRVVGIVETCMAIGSMLGRMIGGPMFDWFGFVGPFIVEACSLVLLGMIGLAFGSDSSTFVESLAEPLLAADRAQQNLLAKDPSHLNHPTLDCKSCYMIYLATAGTILSWLPCGMYDSCLAIHLSDFLGPLSATQLGPLLSITPLVYTFSSMAVAAVVRVENLHRLMLLGAICCTVGLLLVGPAMPLSFLFTDHSPLGWISVVLGLGVCAVGMSMLSIPALPLMQHVVAPAGCAVMESMSKYCIGGMNVGQGAGPVLGGTAMQLFGFAGTTSFGALLFLIWLVVSFISDMDPNKNKRTRDRKISSVPMALEATYAAHWSPVVQADLSKFRRSISI